MLLQSAEAPFAIVECICRKKKALAGSTCKVTDRKETCLAIGSLAQMALESSMGSEITRDEALAIIEQNQKDGLVLQPSNTETAEFICSCCGCCCGMLSIHQSIPKPMDYWASNYYAVVDPQTCTGCGACVKSCQIGAVAVPEKKQPAEVDLQRCFGCGLCVAKCPTESIILEVKPSVVLPPKTREDLYEIIMAHKKGRLGKIKLTGKIVVDAIRTGHLRRLKS
jgi:Pyruvate/2-oxoacid:ferredoxin oxidoreductase delta subunit